MGAIISLGALSRYNLNSANPEVYSKCTNTLLDSAVVNGYIFAYDPDASAPCSQGYELRDQDTTASLQLSTTAWNIFPAGDAGNYGFTLLPDDTYRQTVATPGGDLYFCIGTPCGKSTVYFYGASAYKEYPVTSGISKPYLYAISIPGSRGGTTSTDSIKGRHWRDGSASVVQILDNANSLLLDAKGAANWSGAHEYGGGESCTAGIWDTVNSYVRLGGCADGATGWVSGVEYHHIAVIEPDPNDSTTNRVNAGVATWGNTLSVPYWLDSASWHTYTNVSTSIRRLSVRLLIGAAGGGYGETTVKVIIESSVPVYPVEAVVGGGTSTINVSVSSASGVAGATGLGLSKAVGGAVIAGVSVPTGLSAYLASSSSVLAPTMDTILALKPGSILAVRDSWVVGIGSAFAGVASAGGNVGVNLSGRYSTGSGVTSGLGLLLGKGVYGLATASGGVVFLVGFRAGSWLGTGSSVNVWVFARHDSPILTGDDVIHVIDLTKYTGVSVSELVSAVLYSVHYTAMDSASVIGDSVRSTLAFEPVLRSLVGTKLVVGVSADVDSPIGAASAAYARLATLYYASLASSVRMAGTAVPNILYESLSEALTGDALFQALEASLEDYARALVALATYVYRPGYFDVRLARTWLGVRRGRSRYRLP